jgi:putative sigma-54 modulation protein
MNITVIGRKMNVSDTLQEYAEKKIQKLEKYFHQIIDIKVILIAEKLDKIAEIVILGDGAQFYGKEKAGDYYSALDLLVDKIERQVNKNKNKHQGHKGIHLGELPVVNVSGEDSIEIAIKKIGGKPKDEVEAFLEMKVDKNDFILFKKGVRDIETDIDYANKNYAVLYKKDEPFRLVEIPFEMIKENNFTQPEFIEYDVHVLEDSDTNPRIECKKSSAREIKSMNINEALSALVDSDIHFLPFFNKETNLFNVIYANGSRIELMMPDQ